MISFLIVASGSKGNATLVYDEDTLFQIDMGVPLASITSALETLHKKLQDIQAVLITHEHSDHISGLELLTKRGLSVYASAGTLEHPDKLLTPGEALTLGSFRIEPFSVSHDAANPIGFLISQGNERLVYITDTGYLAEETLQKIQGATYYIFESNHDYKMLLHSHRPASLKHRIHSDYGHLSNSDSAFYLADCVSSATKGIYLAHLSEECNTPELALTAYQSAFEKRGLVFADYHVVCAKQWESVKGGDPE